MTEFEPPKGNPTDNNQQEPDQQSTYEEHAPIIYDGQVQPSTITTGDLLAALKADSQRNDPTSRPWVVSPRRRALEKLQAETDNARKYANPTRFTRARSTIARAAIRQTEYAQQELEATQKVVSLAEWSKNKAAQKAAQAALDGTMPPRSEQL